MRYATSARHIGLVFTIALCLNEISKNVLAATLLCEAVPA